MDRIKLSDCAGLTDRLRPNRTAKPTLRSVTVYRSPGLTRETAETVQQQMGEAKREIRIAYDLPALWRPRRYTRAWSWPSCARSIPRPERTGPS